jgi:truncated hemoglobin YjbI
MAASTNEPPTLYEWAGGQRAFERLLNAFYDRVEGDELLAPLFGGTVGAEHRRNARGLHARAGAALGWGEAPPFQP